MPRPGSHRDHDFGPAPWDEPREPLDARQTLQPPHDERSERDLHEQLELDDATDTWMQSLHDDAFAPAAVSAPSSESASSPARFRHRRWDLFTFAAVALAAGIMLSRWTDWPSLTPLLVAALSGIIIAALLSLPRSAHLVPARIATFTLYAALASAIAALGCAWYALQHTRLAEHDLIAHIADGRTTVHLRGIAQRDPEHRVHAAGSMARFDYRGPTTYFPMRVTAVIDQHGRARRVRGHVLVRISEAMMPFRAGDAIELRGHLNPFQPPTNPGEFDYARYARTLNQAGLLTTPDRRLVHITPAQRLDAAHMLLQARHAVRHRAGAWLLSDMQHDNDQAAGERAWLLSALLLGQRQREYQEIDDAMRRIGLAHLLAISGLHLGVLIGLLLLVAKLTGGVQPYHGWIIILAVLAYLFLIEVRLPVMRAGIMTAIAAMALIVGRSLRISGLVALSALALLLWRPDQLFSPGFQLSFGVVLGLIHCTSPARVRWFGPPQPEASAISEMLMEWVKSTTAAAIVAWCFATSIVLYHFGYFSPLAIVLSIALLPVVALVLALGFIKLLSAPILPSLALAAGIPLTALADVTLSLVNAVDTLPWSSVMLPQPPILWTIAVIGWVLVFLSIGWRHQRRVQLALPLLFIALLLPSGLLAQQPALRIDMLNVGDGSCLIIRSPQRTIVFDVGSSSHLNVGSASIVPAMRTLGIHRIDALVISHADFDHYSAVLDVIDAFAVEEIYVTRDMYNRGQWQQIGPLAHLFEELTRRRIPLRIIAAGHFEQSDRGRAHWTWLHPPPGMQFRRDNDSSMVVQIDAAGRRVLLTGDLQTESIALLMGAYPELQCDILELPHHGSFIEPAVALVEQLSPRIVLQSTGWRRMNPDHWAEIFARMNQPSDAENSDTAADDDDARVQRLITARDGAIWVEIDQDGTIRTGSFLTSEP